MKRLHFCDPGSRFAWPGITGGAQVRRPQRSTRLAHGPLLCKVRKIIKLSLRFGAQVMVRKAARIVIAVWLIAAAQAALAEKRVALVIGNSNYALAPLDNPKNGAGDPGRKRKRQPIQEKDQNAALRTAHAK